MICDGFFNARKAGHHGPKQSIKGKKLQQRFQWRTPFIHPPPKKRSNPLKGVGFSRERIAQYRSQGLNDERIKKLWGDTLKMRALMRKRKKTDNGTSGVSQSWKNADARRSGEFDRRFSDSWSMYRASGWKR